MYAASMRRPPRSAPRPATLKAMSFTARLRCVSMLCVKSPSAMKSRSPSFVRVLPCHQVELLSSS